MQEVWVPSSEVQAMPGMIPEQGAVSRPLNCLLGVTQKPKKEKTV